MLQGLVICSLSLVLCKGRVRLSGRATHGSRVMNGEEGGKEGLGARDEQDYSVVFYFLSILPFKPSLDALRLRSIVTSTINILSLSFNVLLHTVIKGGNDTRTSVQGTSEAIRPFNLLHYTVIKGKHVSLSQGKHASLSLQYI